jgi:hypothetical protein
MKKKCLNLHTNDTNTNRGVIDFFQGELIFLFIISISLHNLQIVSGFFLLNNDDRPLTSLAFCFIDKEH